MRDTSIENYHAHRDSGKLGEQEREVMKFFHRHGGDFTRSELAQATGIRLSAICGRVNTLITKGFLEDDAKRVCKQTGKTVHAVRIKPAQMELIAA